jgi:predicted phage baseplate assembly protein
MPLPNIQLDDRRFEDLFQEVKRRIPRYAPEWTDLNESDPGIALAQLFAWLADMIIYRLNRVPEKNYVKFLELIGIQPTPPAPAQAELTFTLSSKDLPDAILIPQGTQVSLADQVDGGPVIFETDENLYAVGAELKAVQSFDSAQFQLLTEAKRVEGKFFYAFGERPQDKAALYLGFDRSFPTGRHRMLVHLYTADLIEEGQGVGANDPQPAPPVAAYWEYWTGSHWSRLNVVSDDTGSLVRSGFIQFDAPANFQATKFGLLQRDTDDPLFWLRFRIDQILGSGYETPPRLEDVVLNTITATNAVTVTDELLGASNGLPNQEFTLSNTPVLPKTLSLEVDEGKGFTAWTQVTDFAASKRDDKHYTLDLATGNITFGNGEQGKIPDVLVPVGSDGMPATGSAASETLPNIKAATYRWGGGLKGNAGAQKITSLQSSVPYVDSVTNLRPSEGGADEEPLDQVKERAPQLIRSSSRAVTAADFEFLATETPGARIKRAKALPMRHPKFEPIRPAGTGLPAASVPVPGVVTVIVVPDADNLNPKPMPTEETLTRVAGWLKDHSLITTELYVVAPKYRKVEIEARVIASPTANSGIVAQNLTNRLLNYFHPLRGGTDGAGWEFGKQINFSETYRQILTTPNVLRLEADALTIYVDDLPQTPCTDIDLGADELVYSVKHTIFVSYS